jgi:threonyl-tRNA synthetase
MVGFLLEHYAGNFPVWLSPDQVTIVPITDQHNEYAADLAKQMRAAGIRAHADLSADRMNAKIRNAQLLKVPYMAVIGDAEMAAGTIALRRRDGTRQNDLSVSQFIADVQEKIINRSPEL